LSLSDFLAFQRVADTDWQDLPGFPGIQAISLVDNFDPTAARGRRTRLIRFKPGARTETALVHDYWEEAYLIEGELHYTGAPVVSAPAFRCRAPGTSHGPYSSPGGCVLLESHYWDTPVAR
jgi:hypothetical protein